MIGSNLSIFRKGLLLVCLPIGLQLVILITFLRLQFTAEDANHWARHTKEVMATAEQCFRMVAETLAQIRGAIITNNPEFTPDLSLAEERVVPTFDHLADLVKDNPEQARRVNAFRATAKSVMERIAMERHLLRTGQSKEAADMVATFVAERGVESLSRMLGTILSEEQKLDQARLERVESLRQQEYLFVGSAIIATVALAALVLWIFTRNVAVRLNTLAKNAANLAERKPLVASVGGRDEIGRVDQAFRSAAERLAEADVAEQRHRRELEQRAVEVAEANAELARTNNDLRFKTQEIETFVYSVSHDLRSPLVNLQGFSKELARSCEDLRHQADDVGVPAETKRRMLDVIDSDIIDSVRFIQTAVTRSSNIIDALLRLSRAGRLDYKRVRVDVAAIAARVVEAMQSSIRAKDAQIIVHGLPDCESDPQAVEQIFGNLIGNAVNYLDPKRPGRIEIGTVAAQDDDTVQYYVRDNGLGIPGAYLPKMFVAFQRLHGQIAPGEGIGLAMVRRVVDRLGGSIRVESVQGEGSTFYLTLPAAGPAESEGGESKGETGDPARGVAVSTQADPAYITIVSQKD